VHRAGRGGELGPEPVQARHHSRRDQPAGVAGVVANTHDRPLETHVAGAAVGRFLGQKAQAAVANRRPPRSVLVEALGQLRRSVRERVNIFLKQSFWLQSGAESVGRSVGRPSSSPLASTRRAPLERPH